MGKLKQALTIDRSYEVDYGIEDYNFWKPTEEEMAEIFDRDYYEPMDVIFDEQD